jgi:penicillin-binding protein-related factor A (putative recombinase)
MERGDLSQPEKFIENAILDYLALRNVFAWKIKSVGTFDPVEKKFRRPSKRYMKGVSDILGIFNGRPLAIEVKSEKGRLSPHQKLFINRFNESGGMAFVARSVDDVKAKLDAVNTFTIRRP